MNKLAIYETIARKGSRERRQESLLYSRVPANKHKIKDAIRKLPSGNHHEIVQVGIIKGC